MPSVSCSCGARYKIAESSIGKKAKCKKCGETFELKLPEEAEPIAIADEVGFAGAVAELVERDGATPAKDLGVAAASAMALPSKAGSIRTEHIVTHDHQMGTRQYFRDLLATFVFPKKLGNLVNFVVMWVVLVVGLFGAYVPFFGIILVLMSLGWYAAFRFRVIASAAAGEEDVPMLSFEGGIGEGMIIPLLRWVGTWIVVFVPFLVLMTVMAAASISAIMGGVTGIITASGSAVSLLLLVVAGLCLWPMVVLCVALGGFEALVRVDLIASTVVKTLPMYLLTVGIVLGTQYLDYLWHTDAGAAGMNTTSVLSILGVGVMLYLEIIAMRAIGLYYFHFKRSFGWDWG